MADITTISTSSKSSLELSNDHSPNGCESNEKESLDENYNSVKAKQHKYTELNRKKENNSFGEIVVDNDVEVDDGSDDEDDSDDNNSNAHTAEMPQHLTKFFQNKLKRKKKLSISLTSVSDLVNQEKRTRIEGIQLNCRGKLALIAADHIQSTQHHHPHHYHHHNCLGSGMNKMEKVTTKPPIPPSRPDRCSTQKQNGDTIGNSKKLPPPRLKRKLEENVSTIQKLNALTEQMRLEISDLKQNLNSEKGAVRVLRAQNESENRKWKNEVKKLQSTLDVVRKLSNSNSGGNAILKKTNDSIDVSTAIGDTSSSSSSTSAGHELQRLTNEIIALRETNRNLEERKQINSDADRRKAADIRELKDSYEIRLTQLSKSAKIEISRLLEEIKTKERNIGQLKREVQMLQSKTSSRNTIKSGNIATTATTPPPPTNKTQKNPAPAIRTNRNNRRKDSRNVQHPNEVKKLKDFERNHNNVANKNITNNGNNNNTNISGKENILCNGINNHNNNNIMNSNDNSNINSNNSKCFITSTCDEKEYHSMPHEITERILGAHNDVHEYRSKDNNSDSDSALSSAPPSISPQPPSSTGGCGLDTADIWQTIKNYSTDLEKVQKDLDMLQKENESLQIELNLAKEQILESEKTALEANNNKKIQQLLDRIKYLEQKENKLQKESHELREQNELLEFRILELEESNDKWSLHSNASPDNKDMWSGRNKESESDPLHIYSAADRTDSGVTSPYNNHQHHHHPNDDRINVISPCDLNLLEHLTNENLRQRLTSMLKKPSIEEDDRECLQQILQLIQNLDAISQNGSSSDSMPMSGDDEACSFDLTAKSRISDYSSASSASSARSSLAHPQPQPQPYPQHQSSSDSANCLQTRAKLFPNSNSRIVATVLPYNSSNGCCAAATTSTPTDSPSRKLRGAGSGSSLVGGTWNSSSLAESGVFEADFLSDSDSNNVYTQTDPADFANESLSHLPTKDLCAEIQRLNKFREKIEECVTKSATKVPVPHQSILSPSLSDQKRIQFYKERLDLLENKIAIYESSGDLQAKRLADRLQREIHLEKLVKDLRDRVSFLEAENSSLEEEKCEFEEAENDTRLRLQRLEVELEILSQRNIELEMSREALGAKLKDCRGECLQLREVKLQCHSQIQLLEEDNQRIKENFNFLQNTVPTLMLYNAYQLAIKEDEAADSQRRNMGNILPPIHTQNDLFSLSMERDKLLSCCRHTPVESFNSATKKNTIQLLTIGLSGTSSTVHRSTTSPSKNNSATAPAKIPSATVPTTSHSAITAAKNHSATSRSATNPSTSMTPAKSNITIPTTNKTTTVFSTRNHNNTPTTNKNTIQHSSTSRAVAIPSLPPQPPQLPTTKNNSTMTNTRINIAPTTNTIGTNTNIIKTSNIATTALIPTPLPRSPPSQKIPQTPQTTQTPQSPPSHLIKENENLCKEIQQLQEEIKTFRRQINDLNARHYEAMECADSHWVEIEKEYKEREATFRAKESSLKQKICQLQECLTEDARAATEKILQLEESERDLKQCLQKVSREQRDLLDEHRLILDEYQRTKDEFDELKEHSLGPARDAFEREKARNQSLIDEIRFVRKIQGETEMRTKNELEAMHVRLQTLNREYLQIEVTNGELKEEVCTLENQIIQMQSYEKCYIDKIRCLTDEVRTKEDMCAVLEKRLAAIEASRSTKSRIVQTSFANRIDDNSTSNNTSAFSEMSAQSLAQELNGSPVKRAKRDEMKEVRHANEMLGGALTNLETCLKSLPSHENSCKILAEIIDQSTQSMPSKKQQIIKHQIEEDELLTTTPSHDLSESEDTTLVLTNSTRKSELSAEIFILKNSSSETSDRSKESLSRRRYHQRAVIQKYVTISRSGRLKKCSSKKKRSNHDLVLYHDAVEAEKELEPEILETKSSLTSFHSAQSIDCNKWEAETEAKSEIKPQNESDDKSQCQGENKLEESESKSEMKFESKSEKESESKTDTNRKTEETNHKTHEVDTFLKTLLNSLQTETVDIPQIQLHLRQRWELDREFRDGFELVKSLSTIETNNMVSGDSTTNPAIEGKTYEDYARAMKFLSAIEQVYKPFSIPVNLWLYQKLKVLKLSCFEFLYEPGLLPIEEYFSRSFKVFHYFHQSSLNPPFSLSFSLQNSS